MRERSLHGVKRSSPLTAITWLHGASLGSRARPAPRELSTNYGTVASKAREHREWRHSTRRNNGHDRTRVSSKRAGGVGGRKNTARTEERRMAVCAATQPPLDCTRPGKLVGTTMIWASLAAFQTWIKASSELPNGCRDCIRKCGCLCV